MNRKKNKKSSAHVGFRATDEYQKEDFYNRARELKSKGYSKSDIFEAGLLALEGGTSEKNLLRRKTKVINERDEHLQKAIEMNSLIEALNRQLTYNHHSRYKDLDPTDHVLKIDVKDNAGREYKY